MNFLLAEALLMHIIAVYANEDENREFGNLPVKSKPEKKNNITGKGCDIGDFYYFTAKYSQYKISMRNRPALHQRFGDSNIMF